MAKRYSAEHLHRLRNEIPLEQVFRALNWPHKRRDGLVRFLCPRCQEFRTATNPATNLGRCFLCEENFNALEVVMRVRDYDFLTAASYLSSLLGSEPR